MTTSGRYLRLHVCIDNRRALAQRRGPGISHDRTRTRSAVCIGRKINATFRFKNFPVAVLIEATFVIKRLQTMKDHVVVSLQTNTIFI